MARYVMTPARRAALRKAQLISARNRRRHGAVRSVLHSTAQRAEIAYREGQLQHHRAQPQRQVLGQKTKALPKKAAKRVIKRSLKNGTKAAIGAGLTIGAATAIGYTASGISSRQSASISSGRAKARYVHSSRGYSAVHGRKIKALPRGR